MKYLQICSLLIIVIFFSTNLKAQSSSTKPTIILVHGIWADGSSWSDEIAALQAKGYDVVSVQNPLTSLADDVAATKRAIDRAPGKVILVAHSWGGYVITQAGNDPKVLGLVYIAALVPEVGETLPALSGNAAATELVRYVRPFNGFLYLSKDGIDHIFGGDLTTKQQGIAYATQLPAAQSLFTDKVENAAWKTKPSWYVVATADKAINPDLERFMAKRIKAKTTEIDASHAVILSHPKEITDLIEAAAVFPYQQ
ncbi:alpha/beta hydrolase [Mucilaginibacter paludis]|uniref:AB hydrolase-1 domain-containing protein n=1 Tax=Mucilaginibacter paludis DSM 18603 TaxID=714943 RepID=H1Y5B3_9SPHI|nr:alpha/beta hydrolase [Mucilaginibacter paludis]EHQ28924.1 hypothetical protein Mucpa_4839 [Mucilaginibacter paludis DSM 18603]